VSVFKVIREYYAVNFCLVQILTMITDMVVV